MSIHPPSVPPSLTVLFVWAVSTVVHTVTFPEHRLTQSIFTTDILRTALCREAQLNSLCAKMIQKANRRLCYNQQSDWRKQDLLQCSSSLMSPQSFQPSHLRSDLMQRWLLHWNLFGQAVDDRVRMRNTCLMSRNNRHVWEIKTLTVFHVNGLKLCIEASVHIGGVRKKHHAHCVAAAGFCQRSIRLFSTQSEDDRYKLWHVCSVL